MSDYSTTKPDGPRPVKPDAEMFTTVVVSHDTVERAIRAVIEKDMSVKGLGEFQMIRPNTEHRTQGINGYAVTFARKFY